MQKISTGPNDGSVAPTNVTPAVCTEDKEPSVASTPAEAAPEVDSSCNLPKKRYANKLAIAAGKHFVNPLSQKPLMGTVILYLQKWKPTLDNFVDLIDSTVDGAIDTGSGLWATGQKRVHSVLSTAGGLGPTTNFVLPSSEELRGIVASKWGSTASWIDERFDVYVTFSEELTYRWFPDAGTEGADQQAKSRTQRLLAVPYRVRGGLVKVAVMAADSLHLRTQQIIGTIRKCAFTIFVSPKLESPNSMPPTPGGYVAVAYVVLQSSVEQVTHRMATMLSTVSQWRPNAEVFRETASALALNTRSRVSLVSDACVQYYSSWPLPSSEDVQRKIVFYDNKVLEMYKGLPENRQKWMRRQYNHVMRACNVILGGRASDVMVHYLAKSVIVQAVQDQLKYEADQPSTSDMPKERDVSKNVKKE